MILPPFRSQRKSTYLVKSRRVAPVQQRGPGPKLEFYNYLAIRKGLLNASIFFFFAIFASAEGTAIGLISSNDSAGRNISSAGYGSSTRSAESLDEIKPIAEEMAKRVHAHLVVQDYEAACREGASTIALEPDSPMGWQAYIRALAKAGEERKMMTVWNTYVRRFPNECEDSDLLECLAWAVIEKGYVSSTPLIRVMAMLGAFFSQDAKGVNILLAGLQDENSFLRAAAVKLSSHLRDARLQDRMLMMLKTEKVWSVRLELINSMGALQLKEAKRVLQQIIANDLSHVEEKAAAIEALVSLSDSLESAQLARLVSSNRAGMRMLACEFIAYFEQHQDVDKLFPLIHDHHPAVRAKVLQTLGRLRIHTFGGHPVSLLALRLTGDPDTTVAITAAWVLTLTDQPRGLSVFQHFLNHHLQKTRHLAAASLAATGKYGLPLTVKAFKESNDPYVKMNLALSLLGQRREIPAACDCLYMGLMTLKDKWEWEERDNFRVLAPSQIKHDDAIPNYPEAVNQLTRLEILQALAIVHYPNAQKAIRGFLQESHWGISGLASALLLTEGDDEAVDLVRAVLQDRDPKVRVQAALILALWGDGDDVLDILQEHYPDADRELKGHILEGIGRVGSKRSLSFLVERLQEPHQTLRIIAAAALLECLYH